MPNLIGIETFGKDMTAGRGAPIFEVDTTSSGTSITYHPATGSANEYYSGSFRSALALNAPRNIVFKVSGTIAAVYDDYFLLDYPYCSIWGQSAPGEGIIITGGALYLRAGEVFMQHIRHSGLTPTDGLPANKTQNNVYVTNLPGYPYDKTIMDHCSLMWSNDDAFALTGDISLGGFSNNLIGETIVSGPPPGEYVSGCGMVTGYGTRPRTMYGSWYRNFMGSSQKRSPLVGNGYYYDIVNNVMTNTGTKMNFQCVYDSCEWNVVNNYAKDPPGVPGETTNPCGSIYCHTPFMPSSLMYRAGNYNPAFPAYTQLQLIPEDPYSPATFYGPPSYSGTRLSWGLTYPGELSAIDAAASVTDVNTGAGARLATDANGDFVRINDVFRARMLTNWVNNTMPNFDVDPQDPGEGGYTRPVPALGAQPYTDTNHDGVPDSFLLPTGKRGNHIHTTGPGTDLSYLEIYMASADHPEYVDWFGGTAPVITHSSPYLVTAGIEKAIAVSLSDVDSDVVSVQLTSTGLTVIRFDKATVEAQGVTVTAL